MEEAMRSRKLVSFMFGAMMAMAAVTGCGKQGTPAAGTSVQASESVNHTEQAAEAENGDTAGRTKQGHLVETLKLAGGTDWGAPSPYLNASRGPGSAKMNLVFASLIDEDEEIFHGLPSPGK